MAAQPQAFIENQALVIRRATPADAEVCGRICFEAFGTLAEFCRIGLRVAASATGPGGPAFPSGKESI
jgi:hypothetical protein